jgi:triacylglycerol lipase
VPPDALTAAIVLGALAAAALAVWAWRRRTARAGRPICRPRRPTPRYPIVLAHGMFGFDEIRIGRARHDYFRGVSARLERDGWVVHRSRVSKTASISARAAELAAFVSALPDRRVNLIAHSMGGLDARFAVSRLGLGDKIASLTTIGTPHLGTPLADFGAALARRARLWHVLQRMGLELDAFHDLTTARMDGFNRAVPDVRGVHYVSVVGRPPAHASVCALLLPSWLWLREASGGNDGIVPAGSQAWGEVLRTIEADHFAQIGWSRLFDAAELYAEIVRELRARGF